MTSAPEEHEDRRLRRKSAAFRLKHDVGKALRWSAPEERETNPDELRARLVADLLPRTRGGGAGRDVLESFFEWKREEGRLFEGDDPDLEAVGRAMTVVRRLTPGLLSLEESSSLLALDEACLEASRACTAFYRRVALDDGPEIVRPLGARR
ncbi:MAG: hypothetical protein ACHQM4_04275 [Thermoanaerobaculia bacterium]